MLLSLSPSAWSSFVLAPSFLHWLSTLALPTQCFCFSALCSGPLRSLSLSLCSPTLCVLMVVVFSYMWMEGWVGLTLSHISFSLFISFQCSTKLPSTSARPSSKRLYSLLAFPPTFFHRPHHFPSFLVDREILFISMHACTFLCHIQLFSLSLHILNGTALSHFHCLCLSVFVINSLNLFLTQFCTKVEHDRYQQQALHSMCQCHLSSLSHSRHFSLPSVCV